MQFPRTNFHQASQNPSEDAPEATGNTGPASPRPTVDPNAATIEQAPWQAAFKLAPNVRFTRTPEAVIARPRPRDQVAPVAPAERVPAAAGRLVEPVDMVTPADANPALAPEILVQALQGAASAMNAPQPAPLVAQPKVKPQPSPRALIFKRARPQEETKPDTALVPVEAAVSVVAMTAPIAPMAAPVQPAPAPLHGATMQAPAAAPATGPSAMPVWLSDFAFFEGGIALDLPAQVPPMAAPTQTVASASRPAPQLMAGRPAEIVRQQVPQNASSVTSLYREVRTITRPAVAVAPPQPVAQPQAPAPATAPLCFAPGEMETIEAIVANAMRAPVAPAAPAPKAALARQVTHAAAPVVAAAEPVAPQAAIVAEAAPVTVAAQTAAPAQPAVRGTVPVSRRKAEGLLGLGGAMTVRQSDDAYEFPPISLLQEPYGQQTEAMQPDTLQQSAGLLESILEDFGVKGEIIDVRPGPVVTLYEFEPAPGVKSSRVIGLADDIARSMSALSARVAVVPGRNVIGIELPNAVREMVFFRELIECEDYWETKHRLPLCLGKTIGGEPVIAELAKMPHLLVAGTTGSGKSVAINTMILSLLYRLRPEECRLIMIDPKMLELSVYDGIPHLLTPVVTDPKKAVLALKWAVREMEDRYRKMSRLGVRNIDGYNARAAQAREKGETITVSVQTGFDRNTGEIVYEDQELDLSPMPYIVVVVDEMADLMMVAGKEIEGAIQRLAQMARAAGIHLIMATQRPSVDVITGTIKANFPTRISFQVTSKIDSRTILGEQGAEHLLGQGDMLHMAGGGRISRVHGPFVSDAEVEHVVTHLKAQGRPDYLGTVTEDENEVADEDEGDAAVFDKTGMGAEDGDDLYEKAVKVVMKDRKCSTSYIQRRLSIGYNRAASLVERMEQEGLVGPANHVGKREIISGKGGGSQSED
ncbi:DNA translocase FtsK [Rhizobium sp. SL86]|uniref:DNA translocase FtsK n=1 Tax=Rhizobium sp. SL86 TaxID=2995148 RepID=UPI0022750A93|nr:DNA translocase FtsK [Rhizobium sp. SL86]MCY1666984.1 DNA translocase FtsK [Rhizobium sp. SL86]